MVPLRLRTLVKGFLYAAGVLAGVLVLAVAAVLIGGSIEHRFPTSFPKLTGPYPVGRTMFHWVEEGHPEEFAPNSGTKRELIVWVWYPAAEAGPHAEYLPEQWRVALARSAGALMTNVLTRDLARVQISSTEDAPLPAEQKKYPVLVLRAGSSAPVTSYTALAEALASHGYIVVGPDAAYRTTIVVLPDGRTVTRPQQYDVELLPESQRESFATRLAGMWATDIGFVIDELTMLDAADPAGRFTGRLDLQQIGIFGHSLGGATAAYFCHVDARCKAGVDLDGRLFGPVIEDGLKQPFMFVLEEERGPAAGEASKIFAQINSMYSRLSANSRVRVSIVGSNHFTFSDQILLKSQVLLGLMRGVHVLGGLDGRRGLAITADYLCTFFDVNLKGRPRATLDSLRMKYPEATVE
jgi:pimeloyl-ACP methyl ester carboxylesterase